MIPEFPKFKNLEFSDRKRIQEVTKNYPPYSDFNFVSLWSWDTRGEVRVSTLNNNLVVRFSDYITGEPFYSFIGDNKVEDTVEKLLELSSNEGIAPVLRLVPEISLRAIGTGKFSVREDKDNFDYVLSVDRLSFHDGSKRKLSTRRKLINEFKKRKDLEIRLIDLRDKNIQGLISNVFERWESQFDMEEKDVAHLKNAISKLFQMDNMDKILSFGIFLNKVLVGYSINEILPNGYVMGHFQQANTNVFSGMYALLMQETADYVVHLGSKHINIEQDLGIEGLRQWKASCNPEFFLKKYTVSRVDSAIEV